MIVVGGGIIIKREAPSSRENHGFMTIALRGAVPGNLNCTNAITVN
jgi:hypothetical protein